MLSIIFGNAMKDDNVTEAHNIRVYRTGDHAYVGFDTDEIVHVCDETCAKAVLDGTGPWTRTDNNEDAYVDETPQRDTAMRVVNSYSTADVVDFDPGDDPYVLCANPVCGKELLRDDEKFEAMFGHPIITTNS